MTMGMEDLAKFAQQFANASATRSLYKTIASGADISVQEQKVDLVVHKGSAIKMMEETNTTKYSQAGKTAHANALESLKNI